MPLEHDLLHRVDSLQQALRSNKMPTAIFLGAGCPTALKDEDGTPLIPSIDGLTASCLEQLQTACKEPTDSIVGKLTADGVAAPNIERLLSEIRGLLSVVGSGEAFGLTKDSLQKLEGAICEHIAKTMDKELPQAETPYEMLGKWIGAVQRASPVEIFTPNYDLLVEQALENARIPYFDGFSGARQAFFDAHAVENDDLPARWVRLWKLHGSVNWFLDGDGSVFRCTQPGNYSCRLIHPSHLKYDESRKMPYFALLERMRHFLLRSRSLMVVCGYSFRDQHLNDCICDALRANPSGSTVFGLLYGELADYPEALALATEVGNLVLLATNEGVVGRGRGTWLETEPDDSDAWAHVLAWQEHRPSLLLGDFAAFGGFLRDVVGSSQPIGAADEG